MSCAIGVMLPERHVSGATVYVMCCVLYVMPHVLYMCDVVYCRCAAARTRHVSGATPAACASRHACVCVHADAACAAGHPGQVQPPRTRTTARRLRGSVLARHMG